MRKKILNNYRNAFAIIAFLLVLGVLPYLFFSTTDAVVFQFIYYLLLGGVVLILTVFSAITRLSYDDFDRSGLSYHFVGVANLVISLIGIIYFIGAGLTGILISMVFILLISILINRDILAQIKEP